MIGQDPKTFNCFCGGFLAIHVSLAYLHVQIQLFKVVLHPNYYHGCRMDDKTYGKLIIANVCICVFVWVGLVSEPTPTSTPSARCWL